MASFQDDAARRERYAALRAQRIKCEKTFSLCGGVMIFIIAADIISTLYLSVWSAYGTQVANNNSLSEKFGGSNFVNFGCLLFSLVISAMVIRGVHARKMLPVLLGLILTPLRIMLEPIRFFTLAAVPILLCFLSMRRWNALSLEEGFPLFDISLDEHEKRAAKLERITKYAAVENGTRRTAVPDADEMTDLLDTAGDVPVAAAELSGYHDRSRHGRITESGKSTVLGNMDEL